MDDEDEILTQISAEVKRIGAENAAALKRVRDDVDGIMTALRRSRAAGGFLGEQKGAPTEEQKAFGAYLRKGLEGVGVEERKALTVGSDPSGGYLAPSQMYGDVLRYIRELSDIVSRCRAVTVGAGELDIPRVTSGTSAYWTGEEEDSGATEPGFGATALVLHEMRVYCDVTQRLLDDVGTDVEALVAEELGAAFASAAVTALISGNGIKKPLGILSTSGVNEVASGHATTILPDSLIDVAYSIQSPLMQNAAWLMRRTTAAVIRKLKDGNDRYLWGENLVPGQPPMLLGYPVQLDENMPAVGAGAYPVLFGSFERGAFVGTKPDRQGLQMLRDPYSLAKQGKIRLHARQRIGALVVRPQAFTKLKIST